MPLLVVTGYPCCGKSLRTKQLLDWFGCESGGKKNFPEKGNVCIKIVNDELLEINKSLYGDSGQEKKIRGQYLTSVERFLDKSTLVIVDAMNPIKGLRYQLYCIARALGTPHAVLHVSAPLDRIIEWNQSRDLGHDYSKESIEDLISRYEEPIGFNRWDSPLFTIPSEDTMIPESLCIDLFTALLRKQCKPPNLSTVVTPLRTTIQGNDAVIRHICEQIWKAKQSNSETNRISVSIPNDAKPLCYSIDVGRHPLTLHELKRSSFQYMDWIKGGRLASFDCMSVQEVGKSFIAYFEDKRKQSF